MGYNCQSGDECFVEFGWWGEGEIACVIDVRLCPRGNTTTHASKSQDGYLH